MNKVITSICVSLIFASHISSAPVDNASTNLVTYENSQTKDGYRFMYETSDGQIREEMGFLMNPGTPEQEFVVMGRFSYEGDDENVYTVMYTADKNGYKPKLMMKSKKMIKTPMLKKDILKSLIG